MVNVATLSIPFFLRSFSLFCDFSSLLFLSSCLLFSEVFHFKVWPLIHSARRQTVNNLQHTVAAVYWSTGVSRPCSGASPSNSILFANILFIVYCLLFMTTGMDPCEAEQWQCSSGLAQATLNAQIPKILLHLGKISWKETDLE